MAKEIIDSTNPGIVATEVQVNLSDEKLKNALLRVYEEAQKNERTKHVYDFAGVLLSISGTLFLTLLSADFKSIGILDAEAVSDIAWAICILTFILGVVFLYVKYSRAVCGDTIQRDVAVDKVIKMHIAKDEHYS